MISTDFAPNEKLTDAILSIKLILQPWKWIKGQECDWIKHRIQQDFPKSKVFLFLSGRSALFNLLKSLNLPNNSEIIVQAFTCEAVILPIIANNLKPIYVDIETTSFSMDPIDLEKKITKNTRVMILQHTFGLDPINRKKIIDIVNQHKLLLISDIAHCTLSSPTFQSESDQMRRTKFKTQSAKFPNHKSQITNSIFLLSFGRSKALSSVFGSAIIVNNPDLIERLNKQHVYLKYPHKLFIFRLLLYKPLTVLIKNTYDFGLGKILHKILNGLNLLIPEITKLEKSGQFDKLIDYNYPNALACLLVHQFNRLSVTNNLRAQACDFYSKNIRNPDHTSQITNPRSQITNNSLIRYPILIENRDYILSKLYKHNIFLGLWYNQVVAPKSLDLNRVEYIPGSCPIAEDACCKIINLPTNITLKQAKKIVKILVLNDVI